MQTKAVTKVNDPGQIHKYSHIILDEARWLSVANAEATEAHTHTQVQGNHILSLDAKPKKHEYFRETPLSEACYLLLCCCCCSSLKDFHKESWLSKPSAVNLMMREWLLQPH
jgi:hypothetical protein